jgi:transcriptional regulator with XRE-family HTH domain
MAKVGKRGGKGAASRGLTRRGLSEALGVHMMTITKWERAGMPIAERGAKGRPSYYDEAAVRAWVQLRDESARKPNGPVDLVADRARKERAQAALAEQAYLIRHRDLLPREEVERTWAGEVSATRAKLLSWSLTLADKLHRAATTEGVPGVEQLLAEEVRDVLRELAARE